MSTKSVRRVLGGGVAAALLALGVAAFAPAAGAQSDNQSSDSSQAQTTQATGHHRHRPPRLTDAQRSCLSEHGVNLPAPRGDQANANDSQGNDRTANRNSDQSNDQRRPMDDNGQPAANGNGPGAQDGPNARQGQGPTEEQRAAFRAAADACGIQLPAHPRHQGNDSQDSSQSQPRDNGQDQGSQSAPAS